MWLSVLREDEISSFWNPSNSEITVECYDYIDSKAINNPKFKRVSQLFDLNEKNGTLPSFKEQTFIRFYFFKRPMKTLGKMRKLMSQFDLRIFFGFGLCSVVIISKEVDLITEFIEKTGEEFVTYEEWQVENNKLQATPLPKIPKTKEFDSNQIDLIDYSGLPKAIRSVFEELHLLLNIFSSKMDLVPQENLFGYEKMHLEINSLIENIKKYQSLLDQENEHAEDIDKVIGLDSESLANYEERINTIIKYRNYCNQYIDRAVQLVSVLSYTSTQTFSGIIPVLSRRSLLRRHSLLGIGSSILALYRVTHFIENIFHNYNWVEKITIDFKAKGSYLPDINDPHKYDIRNWKNSNVDEFTREQVKNNDQFKLPYYSARHAFRESEYSVSAAIQSITNGVDPEWSIMTITHELMHSQVRRILNLIIAGDLIDESKAEKENVYNVFDKISTSGFSPENTLLDSVRYIIFTHCCLADKYGSLTVAGESLVSGNKDYNIPNDYGSLFELLMHNYKSINEIFVHVFDYNYIYRGQIEFYMISIWHSWSALPSIYADLRQYILRSLIIISTKVVTTDPFKRFEESVSILKNSMRLLYSEIKRPLIAKIIIQLNDINKLQNEYYGGFYSHLMLVDMISKVFISDKISSGLYKDDLVEIVDENLKEELNFKYLLENEFEDVSIDSPIAFLLDRIQKINSNGDAEYSRETCKALLSII